MSPALVVPTDEMGTVIAERAGSITPEEEHMQDDHLRAMESAVAEMTTRHDRRPRRAGSSRI